jgi:phosphoribosylglycinamide formyltransferase-1
MKDRKTMNIAVFASHGGSDLQAIMDACRDGRIDARVSVVISNNRDAKALERAQNAGIDACHISLTNCQTQERHDARVLEILTRHHIDIIFLAGYLKKLGTAVLSRFENRIFNIHPSLLPKYGGLGMYGLRVHEAVLAAGERATGITVHRVNEAYDEGGIIAQTCVEVLPTDTPETLAARVLEREHSFIVEVLRGIIAGINDSNQI